MLQRTSLGGLAIWLLLPGSALAQTRATGADLNGTVVDESGGTVPGASVTAINAHTNVARTTTTDTRGHYTVAALPPGTYTVRVALTGFASQTREGVVLMLGQYVPLDFKLPLSTIAEVVNVTAEAPVVEVSHTEVSSVINQQQIANLPINGRDFMSFSVMTPG